MQTHGRSNDPYRLFFPLGILLGIVGVSIWPLYFFGVTDGYSGRAHAFVQTYGFLYAFIAGFLLTAVPRFTGTEPPALKTQLLLAALIVTGAGGFEMQLFAFGNAAFLVTHGLLIILIASRFLQRRQEPPDTFPLVGVGLIAGTLGALINAGIAWNWASPSLDLLGKRLLTEGMVLLLVLGIGGFLGPRLLGFADMPKMVMVSTEPSSAKRRTLFSTVAGLFILTSLIAEYGLAFNPRVMAFVRAIAATAVILSTIQPWKLPKMRTTLAWCVWAAYWLVILSLWLMAIAPPFRIDMMHVLFIGGFTLLILGVATRVTLSHGGHNLTLERRSWPLRIGLATGLIAMLARVGAPFAPAGYFDHLAWAALLWIAGMLFWGVYLVRWSRRDRL